MLHSPPSLCPALVCLGVIFVRKRPVRWDGTVTWDLMNMKHEDETPGGVNGCCSPSWSVASPLWIWTCSSCASEERWWRDTGETNREREDRITGWLQFYYISLYQAFTHLIRLLFHCWLGDVSQQNFGADAAMGCCDKLLQYCGRTTIRQEWEKDQLYNHLVICNKMQDFLKKGPPEWKYW